MGPWRNSIAFSAIVALISPPKPPLPAAPLRGPPLRSLEADVAHVPVRDQGAVGPPPPRLRGPEGDRVLPLRDLLPEGPVQLLRLEEEDGVRVADRGRQEPFRVRGGRGHDDLEPRRVAEVRL